MNADFLLEIGAEEMPARFVPPALAALGERARADLAAARLPHGAIRTAATPRRLALLVEDLAERQEDRCEEVVGPSRQIAFGADGAPTKAAVGFARRHGVDPSDLKIVSRERGEFVSATKLDPGRETRAILSEIVPGWIGSLPFPRSMRWGEPEMVFARPIHWILSLFGGRLAPMRFGSIEAGVETRGHRFAASDEGFVVDGFRSYAEGLESRFVIVDPEARRERIRREIASLAVEVGGLPREDPELLDEIVFLVEWPVGIRGSFDPAYLAMPAEVLISAMRNHQRYVAVVDGAGRLLPHFITVANTPVRDPAVVRRGNERVLRARLADAHYFFEEDRKTRLASRVEGLKGVVFHSKLGTSYEKVERVERVARWLADRLGLGADPGLVGRAVRLSKADLLTGMVGEFPDLQGIVGREYALLEGEPPEVALAISEHYLPRFAGDATPAGDMGALVGIADRTDSIAGYLGVGLAPTGTADPYALRRKALGVLAVTAAKGWTYSLPDLVRFTLAGLRDKLARPEAEVERDVLDFVASRLHGQLAADGVPADVVEAVLAGGLDEIAGTIERARLIARWKTREDFVALIAGYKRAANILRGESPGEIRRERLAEPAERDLDEAAREVEGAVARALAERRFEDALSALGRLRGPIDRFFEAVLVMAEDPEVRSNRLALLARTAGIFRRLGDLSRIQA